jgi:hypothetical protein
MPFLLACSPVFILALFVSTAALQAILDALPEGCAPGKRIRGEHRAGRSMETTRPGVPNRD